MGRARPATPQWPAPNEGGIYMPKAPRVDPPRSGVGRPRQHKRPRGEARGNPGEPIGE
jgi:hypothetical protein